MIGRYCVCRGTVINGGNTCNGCLMAKTILVGCGQGLNPCGGTTDIDLKDYNQNPSTAVYSLKKADSNLGSVTVSNTGIVHIVTKNHYQRDYLYVIDYEVNDPVKNTKNFGTIKLCVDNPCQNQCLTCNPCTGECYGNHVTDIELPCNSINQVLDAKTVVNAGSCAGTSSWRITGMDAGVSATISNAGIITYSVDANVQTDKTYRIVYEVKCSDGMIGQGIIAIYVPNLCNGIDCGEGQHCNPCTGMCEDSISDLGINKTGFAAMSDNNLKIG